MKEILQKALAVSNADYCEIRLEETHVSAFRFAGQEIDFVNQSVDSGGCVRALVGNGWGFVTFNKLTDLKEKVRQAEKQARIIADLKQGQVKLATVPVVEDEVFINYLKDPRTVSLSDKVDLFTYYNNLVLNYHEKIATSSTRYFDKHTDLYFANTEGTYIYQEKIDLGGAVVAIGSDGHERTQDAYSFGSSNDYNVVQGLEDKVLEVCDTAVKLLEAETVRGGQYTVVADPHFAGLFVHEAFGHLSEADDIYQNEDAKRMMELGRRFGKPLLNIYDTGLAEGHRGYMKYDDEGVASQTAQLISEGKLVGRLHSRLSAGEMGEKPTGNARALNYSFAPICRMRTTCIAPGEATVQELISSTERGLYAVGGYGGETNGEMFTFVPSKAYMIRNGQIGELVKNVSISGNVFATLAEIDMIANDFMIPDTGGGCGKGAQSPLPTSEGSPHIRIGNAVVGGER